MFFFFSGLALSIRLAIAIFFYLLISQDKNKAKNTALLFKVTSCNIVVALIMKLH